MEHHNDILKLFMKLFTDIMKYHNQSFILYLFLMQQKIIRLFTEKKNKIKTRKFEEIMSIESNRKRERENFICIQDVS